MASWARAVLGLVVVVAAVALWGTPAAAHNSFKSSNPADKAVLDRVPAVVTLTFLARLTPQGTTVALTDPAGGSAAGGAPAFDGATVSVPLRATVPGAYTATYRVPSADGHAITGKITFMLTEKAVPAPTSAPPPQPSPEASPAAAPSAVPSLRNAAAEDAGGVGWWPWAAGAVLLGAVAGALVLRRRRT